MIYHDFPGIMRYMENPDGPEAFSPRSSGYARYNVNQSKRRKMHNPLMKYNKLNSIWIVHFLEDGHEFIDTGTS